IGKVLKTGLTELGHEVFEADFEKYMSRFLNRFQTQAFRLPFKLRNIWEDYYSNEINKFFVTEYDRIKPDLVFVYNDSKLISDTVKYFQKKTKVVFYLGDNPFYTWTKVNFLNLIMDADFIFAPDTMWVEQLRMLGIKNIEFEVLGSDP